MALLDTFTKQPREILDFDISYAQVLQGRTDYILSATAEVSPPGLTAVYSSVTANVVKVVISGGTTGITYKVTVLSTSSTGLVYEDEVNVLVEEV